MPSLAAVRAAAGPTPSSEVSGRASRLGRGSERSGTARQRLARLRGAAAERPRRLGCVGAHASQVSGAGATLTRRPAATSSAAGRRRGTRSRRRRARGPPIASCVERGAVAAHAGQELAVLRRAPRARPAASPRVLPRPRSPRRRSRPRRPALKRPCLSSRAAGATAPVRMPSSAAAQPAARSPRAR